jgi:hypothetical protein
MSVLLDLVFEVVGGVIWWILLHLILVPCIYVVATPLILIVALFGSGTYGDRVRSGYRAVQDFWFAFLGTFSRWSAVTPRGTVIEEYLPLFSGSFHLIHRLSNRSGCGQFRRRSSYFP